MTSNQRLRSALLGLQTDRVPFSPFLAYVWEYFPKEIQRQGQLVFYQKIGADPLWRGCACPTCAPLPQGCETRTTESGDESHTYITTPVGTLHSMAKRSSEGNTWFLIEHPLKTREDFLIQIWIERHTEVQYDPAGVLAHLNGEGQEGLSVGMLTPRCKSAFQSLVEHHVGTEELAYALADFPEAVEELLAAMVRVDQKAVELAVQCPLEFYLTWEDSSTQNYSPTQYHQYIFPQISQWCQTLNVAGKHYLQHACGHVKDLLSDMMGQGNLGIESISPLPTGNVSIAQTRKVVGEKFAIVGGIEPTHLLRLQGGAFDDYVERVLQEGAGGAFVLANSDSCPPGVSPEKFARAAQIARGWRR